MLPRMENTPPFESPAPEAANPYAPPKAALMTAERGRVDMERFGPATKGKRFLNYLIDQFGQFGLAFGMGMVLIFLQELGWNVGMDLEEDNKLQDWIWGAVMGLVYYSLFETWFGRTPGKWITGTCVVNLDGSRPGFGKVLQRTLSRLVPFEAFSFLGSGDSGWHDKWSDTVVVDLRNEQPHRMSASLRKFYR